MWGGARILTSQASPFSSGEAATPPVHAPAAKRTSISFCSAPRGKVFPHGIQVTRAEGGLETPRYGALNARVGLFLSPSPEG